MKSAVGRKGRTSTLVVVSPVSSKAPEGFIKQCKTLAKLLVTVTQRRHKKFQLTVPVRREPGSFELND
jgi:hypothetical protein